MGDEPVIDIKHMNVRDLPPANLTKSLFTNENTINKRPSTNGKLSKKKKMSPIVFPSQTVSINKYIPDPQVIKKCSLNETNFIKVDNYPRQDLSDLFRTSKFMSPSYFGTDTVTNDIQTRISNSNLETFCESKEDIILKILKKYIMKVFKYHLVVSA